MIGDSHHTATLLSVTWQKSGDLFKLPACMHIELVSSQTYSVTNSYPELHTLPTTGDQKHFYLHTQHNETIRWSWNIIPQTACIFPGFSSIRLRAALIQRKKKKYIYIHKLSARGCHALFKMLTSTRGQRVNDGHTHTHTHLGHWEKMSLMALPTGTER